MCVQFNLIETNLFLDDSENENLYIQMCSYKTYLVSSLKIPDIHIITYNYL